MSGSKVERGRASIARKRWKSECFNNPMSQARRIQARHWVTDFVSHRESRSHRKELSDSEGYCWMPQREQQSASLSSGRNGSLNPNAEASGDRLQSFLPEDDDRVNLLSPGVKLVPNLMTRVEEHVKKTFGTLSLTIFPVNKVLYFRTRLHVGIIPDKQIRRGSHQRLSELFLFRYAGHTEHPKWKSSSNQAGR